jgi:simple sugar transport system permease protein
MTPLVFTAVAVALPARIGLINVGGEGQLYMGACLATAGALALPDQPAFVLLPLLVVLGFIGGGLWALVPGVLRALHLVNETISTLLLNYVAPLIVSYLIFGPWREFLLSAITGFRRRGPAPELPPVARACGSAPRARLPCALLVRYRAHALRPRHAGDRRKS